MEPQRVRNQRTAIAIVGSLIAVVALVLGIVLATHDDDKGVDATATSTSTSTTAVTTSTTTAPTTTTTISPQDLDLAIFPDLTTSDRFQDPAALAKAFATDLLGYDTDVVVGPFQQGDNRSGELTLNRPGSTAKTTVAVRQIGDGSWVVLGATTPTIVLDTPMARTRISSPQPLIGAATAFEGQVDVMLYADGQDAPIATSSVTGRGDGQLGDFNGSISFQVPRGATRGVLVLSEASADDGTTVAATAVRVRF